MPARGCTDVRGGTQGRNCAHEAKEVEVKFGLTTHGLEERELQHEGQHRQNLPSGVPSAP